VNECVSALQNSFTGSQIRYHAADVTSLNSLRKVFERIVNDPQLGVIRTVVHTAGIVKDSLVVNTNHADFLSVMRPKALGAWNAHVLCTEMKLDLKRFVMLSSISVPFGRVGQVSYVAGNAFMDALAAYRRRIVPSCRSISLQLGAWESRLTKNMTFDQSSVLPISHSEGIRLLFDAIDDPRACAPPIVAIAKLNVDILRKSSGFSSDPYFNEFISEAHEERRSKAKVMSEEDLTMTIQAIFKDVLGDETSENIDLSAPIMSLGLDSIGFTQVRGAVFKTFEVDLPVSFFGNDITAKDIVLHVAGAI